MIDYSKYTLDELSDAKAHIDAKANPENYQALLAELENRSEEIQQRLLVEAAERKAQIERNKKWAESAVPIVGYLQLAAGGCLLLIGVAGLIDGLYTSPVVIAVTAFLVVLNGAAGYTAVKKKVAWYWLSLANQFLQVIKVATSSLAAGYWGVVSFNLGLSWMGEESRFGLEFATLPGFIMRFSKVESGTGFLMVNLVPIVMIIGLLVAREAALENEAP